MSTGKCKVYIASPYTLGDTATNVKVQLDLAGLLMDIGLIPFAPLTSHFIHMANPKTYDMWISWALEWVRQCDAILRVPGVSKGADLETDLAFRRDISVFSDIEELCLWCYRTGWHLNKEYSITEASAKYRKIIEIDSSKYI